MVWRNYVTVTLCMEMQYHKENDNLGAHMQIKWPMMDNFIDVKLKSSLMLLWEQQICWEWL